MTFKKAFRNTSDKSVYPNWVEVELTSDEEKKAVDEAHAEQLKTMLQCVDDASVIADEKDLSEHERTHLAVALFDKRASHDVFYKENHAREKFDDMMEG